MKSHPSHDDVVRSEGLDDPRPGADRTLAVEVPHEMWSRIRSASGHATELLAVPREILVAWAETELRESLRRGLVLTMPNETDRKCGAWRVYSTRGMQFTIEWSATVGTLVDCFATAHHDAAEIIRSAVCRHAPYDAPKRAFLLSQRSSEPVGFLVPEAWGFRRRDNQHECRPKTAGSAGDMSAGELTSRLLSATSRAKELPDLLASSTPAAGDEACAALLERRWDAWQAYLALDEQYASTLDQPGGDASAAAIEAVLSALEAFDGALEQALPLIRPRLPKYLLDNWRTMLTGTHAQCPPWWL
jgi:hypothetical protein